MHLSRLRSHIGLCQIWVWAAAVWLLMGGFQLSPRTAAAAEDTSEQEWRQLTESPADPTAGDSDSNKRPEGASPAAGLHSASICPVLQAAHDRPLGQQQYSGTRLDLYLLFGALRLGGC